MNRMLTRTKTMNSLYLRAALAILILLPFSFCAPDAGEAGPGTLKPGEFEAMFPKPAWWDEVSLDGYEATSPADFNKYWREKGVKDRSKMFKVAYGAILKHPDDTVFLVEGTYYMTISDRSYPHMIPLLEYIMERHFHYKSPPGIPRGSSRTIGELVRTLSVLYRSKSEPGKGIAIIRRFLKERGDEETPSFHVAISLDLARALYDSGEKEAAVELLRKTIEINTNERGWGGQLRRQLSAYEKAMAGSTRGKGVVPDRRPQADPDLYRASVPGYYKWVDKEGTLHITNDPTRIPPGARSARSWRP